MKNTLLFSFLFIAFVGFSQPENATVEVINGKRFYVHIVQVGNTLYGIHRLYNTPVETIVQTNPGSEKGLAEGQRILIPIEGTSGLEKNLAIHRVAAKETLYGIARKYNTTPEELIKLNPELSNGLKIDQEIKVPVTTPVGSGTDLTKQKTDFKISFTDTLINHEVQRGETLYSLSKRYMVSENDLKEVNGLRNNRIRPGDVLQIPIKKEKVEPAKVREIEPIKERRIIDSTLLFNFRRKDTYKIALLMPLMFGDDAEFKGGVTDMAAEYYMGTKLALDSLEKMGLKAQVFVYDSKNDSVTIQQILNKPEFKDMDLIFGPFYGNNANYVADWARDNKVKMICPFSTNYTIVKDNPLVFEAVTSDVTLAEGLAKHLLKIAPNEQVILVKPKNKADQALYDAFRNQYVTNSKKKLIETSIEDLGAFLQKDVKMNLVCLTTDKSSSLAFMNSLTKSASKYSDDLKLTVYGTKDWVNYDDITTKFKNKFHVHFATPFDFDYSKESNKALHKVYRQTYNSDMTKMAIQGFDVTLYFAEKFLLNKEPREGVMNDIKLVQKGWGNGFENKGGFIFKFENFEIIKVAKLND